MSTKTTIKRIALVAVASLGLGVVAGIPANASRTLANISNVNSITVSTDAAPVAGANGNSSVHTFTFTTDSTASAPTISPYIKLVSEPATSSMAKQNYATGVLGASKWQVSSTAITHTPATWTAAAGTAWDTLGADVSCATLNAAGNYTCKLYVQARYTVPGTYVWSVFDDSNADGVVNGGDYAQSFSVVVGASTSSTVAASATLTAVNSTSAAAGANGSLLKLVLKDAAGNPIGPDQSAGVKVSVTGSAVVAKVNGATPTGTGLSSYTLGAGAFDGTGTATINVTDATAETVYVSVSGIGFSTFTAPATIALTYKTITATATAALTTVLDSATNPKAVSSTSYQYNGKAGTVSFKTNTAAATYDKVTITDASGTITGVGGAYDIAVLGATTGTDKGSFSITFAAATTTSTTFTVNGGSTVTLAPTAAAAASITNLSASSFLAAAGSKISITAKVKDQYGAAYANQTVTPTISGRNSGLTLSNMVSDASGLVTFTYTDASTSTTSLSDNVTLTAGSYTATAAITYTSAANLGVKTISLVTPSETTAGTVNTPAVNSAINAGDGAEGGAVSVTATVKDANGVTIAGVPVTFTVSGTGAAITSTTKTVYTGATGTATASLYAWIAGKYTVTATYGTVSDDATSTWTQEDGTYSRTVSVVANGASAIATVKDRFGNPVKGVVLTATRVGTGSFGGASSINATTAADGTAEFILTGGTGTVTVAFSSSTYGQSDALKGLIDGTTSTNTFTATTAGTALVAEAGVGASYDAAGINSASVEVSGVATSDAIDAANEATDAANAATDAANAAAEAADAATAAAQDAQAAVAALATQVASLIAGIKAQITALTNLVIKIQTKVKA